MTGQLEAAGLDPIEVVPLLAPLLALDVDERWSPPELDAPALRAETLKALVDWLAHFARATPSLLLVEDLHWADPTTVDLLGLMIEEAAPGMMVLVTSRQPTKGEWPAQSLDIELGPLAEEEAATLVAAVAADADLEPAQYRLIIERGAGVPLFLQELTRSAVTASPGEVLPPRSTRSSRPACGLPASTSGWPSWPPRSARSSTRSRCASSPERPVDEALARSRRPHIIEPVGEARRAVYRFRHVLLRDAAYETQVLSPSLHAHTGSPSSCRPAPPRPGDLAVVAQHWDLAGDVGAGPSRPTSRRPRRRSRRPVTPRRASCSTAPWSWRRRCPRATSAT